jgi:hypothetical protein
MNTKKAYIKLNGEIGEKEQPAVEFIDKGYSDRMAEQHKKLNDLLKKTKNAETKKEKK